MNRALFVTAALTLGAITTPAMAAQTWMCRVAPGPLFSDVQQCNAFCLEAQGGLDPDSDEPIYLCEIYRPGGGGGGGGGGPIAPEPAPMSVGAARSAPVAPDR
jgi:hypothetical protein